MGTVKQVTGELKALGNARFVNATRAYSIIEMSSAILEKVAIYRTLDNFLESALQSRGETTLYVQAERVILGLKTPDGKCYFTRPARRDVFIGIAFAFTAVICLLLAVLGFDPANHGLFVFALPGLFMGSKAMDIWSKATDHKRLAAELTAQGGVAIDA